MKPTLIETMIHRKTINPITSLLLLCGTLLCPANGRDAETQSGLEIIAEAQGEWTDHPDTDWIDWVVVSLAPTRSYFPGWTDEQRAELIEDFDPDFLDMWSGAAMNRGDFFGMRGVATNAPMEYEYQEAINPVAHYGWEFFRDNGIGRKEDGQVALRPFTPTFTTQTLTVMAPKWHEVVKQGIIRPGLFEDAVFQDNLANPIYTWGQGFSDWANRRFVDFMTERFNEDELAGMGFDPSSFRIVDYMKAKRAAYDERLEVEEQQLFQEQEMAYGSNLDLLQDPIIKEFIRFQYVENMALAARKADALRRTAMLRGKPVPAFYGNLPRISGIRAAPTIMISQVDAAWSEESTQVQPPFFHGRQAWSSLLYKVGRAAGYFEKPVFTVQYHGGKHSPYGSDKVYPTALALAEAHANGGIPVQTWVATEWTHLHQRNPLENQEALQFLIDVNRDHANFVGENRVLFTDRESVAKVALVHSLTSTFWRQFQSLTVPREHLDHFTAVARFLEESHVPYEILVLGHPDVFDDSEALSQLDQYDTIILPEVDCISDLQAEALSTWADNGGNLVLWGDGTGTRDEELNPRGANAFARFADRDGPDNVTFVSDGIADPFSSGTAILGTSSEEPSTWRYSFSGPQRGWTDPDFDDSSWRTGTAPFGSRNVRGVEPNTEWTTPDIFMRKTFTLEEITDDPLFLSMIHWWDVSVYINGVEAVRRPDRGRVFDGYQDVWLSEEALAALRPGENTIAVQCRQNPEHISWGQIIDVGLYRLLPNEAVASLIPKNDRLLETDLPGSVWANVWKYGAGPMTSVMLVNYDIDLENDTVASVEDFRIRLSVPDPERIQEAYWFSARYGEPQNADPIALPLKRGEGWVETTVPRLDLFGAVVFAAEDELAARTAAAEARKSFERIRIAQRSLDENPVLDSSQLGAIQRELSTIQGEDGVDKNFQPLVARYQQLAARLEADLQTVTAEAVLRERSARETTLALEAVRKFDFGTAVTEPGWQVVEPDTAYSEALGYGWVVNEDIVAVDQGHPDGVHRDFIRNIDPADADWPGRTKNIAYPYPRPPQRPGVFRVDLPNGEYRVTVLTGDFDDMGVRFSTHTDGKTASTYVDASGDLKLLGQPLASGDFESRAFKTEVTDGNLELEFHGANVGPLYASSIEWLVNGLVIQRIDQSPSAHAAASQERNTLLEKNGIRNWVIVGPFEDSDYLGMETMVGPEARLVEAPAVTLREGNLQTTEVSLSREGIPVVDLSELFGSEPGQAALATARIESPSEQDALLGISLSQVGAAYLNGEQIHRDEYAAGLMPSEAVLPVRLKPGPNYLVIKSLHFWGKPWSLAAWVSGSEETPFGHGTEKKD